MKVSAQEEYGLRCLLRMARHGAMENLSIPEISRAEGLTVPNVAKLVRILRLGGLVRSSRGQAGGYSLARPADQITLDEILQVLGGPLFCAGFCQRHTGSDAVCCHEEDCTIRPVWMHMQELLSGVLTRTTLQDLLQSEREMNEWLSDGGGDGNRNVLARTTVS